MARTGQDLLNYMEVLHPELQNQVGEADVAKSLLALNMAQDYMESVLAQQPDLLGDATGPLTAANGVEKTRFPQGVLRLDALQMLSDTTGLPTFTLDDIRKTGGQVAGQAILPILSVTAGGGSKPLAYYTDGTYVYWAPVPDTDYSLRWYGFQAQADITAAGTYGYTDITMLPVATFAVRIIRTGLDDDVTNYTRMATDTFEPVVNLLGNFQRQRGAPYQYRYYHST